MPRHTEAERRQRRQRQQQTGGQVPSQTGFVNPRGRLGNRQPTPPAEAPVPQEQTAPQEQGGIGRFFPGLAGGAQALREGDFSSPRARAETVRRAVGETIGPTVDFVGNVVGDIARGAQEFGSALFGRSGPPPVTPSTGVRPTPVQAPQAPSDPEGVPAVVPEETAPVTPPQAPGRFGPNRVIENPTFEAGRGVPGSPPGTQTGVPEGLTEVIRGTTRFLEQPGIGGATFDVTTLNALGGMGNPIAERLAQAVAPLSRLLAGTGFEGGPEVSTDAIAASLEQVSNAFDLELRNADVGSAERIAELDQGVRLEVARLGLSSALAASQKGRFKLDQSVDTVTGKTNFTRTDTATGEFETFSSATMERVQAKLKEALIKNNQADIAEDEKAFRELMAQLLGGPRSALELIIGEKIGGGSIQRVPGGLGR